MQIQVNTDHNIEGAEALSAHVRGVVADVLDHFSDQITRVEVHLGDENGAKSGQDDMRCMLEARLEGRPPVAVTHHAATLHMAIDGAAEKLARMIGGKLGRQHDQKIRGDDRPTAELTNAEE